MHTEVLRERYANSAARHPEGVSRFRRLREMANFGFLHVTTSRGYMSLETVPVSLLNVNVTVTLFARTFRPRARAARTSARLDMT